MAKSILVTGVSTGFGTELALYLAEHGLRVYATMPDLRCRESFDAEVARRKLNVRVVRMDVTDPASVEEAVQDITAEAGSIDGLVNNAGLFLRGYFEDLLEDEIRGVFETNLFGTMAVTRAVLPHMRSKGQGRIVVISSIAGKIGAPSGSAYSSSRFAQEGFAEALSLEVEPLGIRVVLVEPGIVKTETWTIDRCVAVRARHPESPYYDWFGRAEELFDQAMDSSPIAATDVAQTVYRALTVKRPRRRYRVGRRASLVIALRRYLPERWFERLYFGAVIRRVAIPRHAVHR